MGWVGMVFMWVLVWWGCGDVHYKNFSPISVKSCEFICTESYRGIPGIRVNRSGALCIASREMLAKQHRALCHVTLSKFELNFGQAEYPSFNLKNSLIG